MNADLSNTKIPAMPVPDDRLREIDGPEPIGNGSGLASQALAGFVLLKLHGYQKPPLAEELSEPGGGSGGGCTCNSVCTCVPVQTCACDSVCTCDTVTSYTPGGGGGGGMGGYWTYRPCF
mgnify:CR=1 FL=1